MLNLLIGPIAELAGTWLNGKVEKTKAETGAKVQEFQTTLQKNLETFNTSMAKYSADVSQVNTENQNLLGKFSQDLANYSAKIQKDTVQYKWLQERMMYLREKYNSLFGINQAQ